MNPSNDRPTSFWHDRFVQQAAWTESLRQKLLSLPEPETIRKILEVGSGTGVILKQIDDRWPARTIGVDLDLERLKFGRGYAPHSLAVNGDGRQLPIRTDSVDLTVCHFLLLWIDYPLIALQEMVRVTRPRGWVMAMAEPDYGGRIDYPPRLSELGQLQIQSLERQGADPLVGRRLLSLFLEAGLSDVKTGILGGEWPSAPSNLPDRDKEWQVLSSDLSGVLDKDQMAGFKQDWFQSGRILYVPTFYAYGQVPG